MSKPITTVVIHIHISVLLLMGGDETENMTLPLQDT